MKQSWKPIAHATNSREETGINVFIEQKSSCLREYVLLVSMYFKEQKKLKCYASYPETASRDVKSTIGKIYWEHRTESSTWTNKNA